MSGQTTPAGPPRPGPGGRTSADGGGRRRLPTRLGAAGLALVCWLAVIALWVALVGTYTGQRLEQLALTGSLTGAHHVSAQARRLLSLVSMPAAVALVVLILGAGLWSGRRHPATRWRSVWAAGTVVAINLSTQVLKHWVFTRPDYGMSWRYDGANTLPSGHTAMAASAAVAAVLVAPAAWRAWAAWGGAALAAAMGYSTLVCQWHRPADVLTAILLAVGWAAAAVACGAWSRDGQALRLAESARRWLGRLGLVSGACAVVAEAVALVGTLGWVEAVPASAVSSTGVTWWVALAAYAAGAAGTVAVACLGTALLAGLTPPVSAR